MIKMFLALCLLSGPVFADTHDEAKDKRKHRPHGHMFEKKDTNKDGVISEDEFLSHAKERFSKMDANGDGNVSKDEAKAHKKAKRAIHKKRREDRSDD